MHQITVPDPGYDARLHDNELDDLLGSLKKAKKAAAVLIVVEGDGWAATTGVGPSVGRAVETVRALGMPVVCHLAGRVTGAGLGLALACDLRFAGPGSTWGLGDPAGAPGIGAGSAWLLRDRLGSALLDHLTWTGDLLTAEEAARSHLVSGVGNVAIAAARAKQLAALPSAATSVLKRGSRAGQAPLLAEQLGYEGWLHRVVETAR